MQGSGVGGGALRVTADMSAWQVICLSASAVFN